MNYQSWDPFDRFLTIGDPYISGSGVAISNLKDGNYTNSRNKPLVVGLWGCPTTSVGLIMSEHPTERCLTIGDPYISGVENVKCRM